MTSPVPHKICMIAQHVKGEKSHIFANMYSLPCKDILYIVRDKYLQVADKSGCTRVSLGL